MSIDADEFFRKVAEDCAEGGAPSYLLQKVDYQRWAEEELIKIIDSLGHEGLSVDEFLALYKKRAGIGSQ